MAYLLFHVRTAPHGRSSGEEALEAVLAASVFEPPLTVLFEGDGVLQVVADQEPSALGSRDTGANWTALPAYDVTDVRVHGPSLVERGLSVGDLAPPVVAINDADMAALIATVDRVLSF